MSNSIKVITNNKKAHFNYFVEDTIEAGISLLGPEVKSLRQGSASLDESFVYITNNLEVIIKNLYIKKFDYATNISFDERRDRKLLLKKSEISKLLSKVQEKGYTLIPIKIYFSGKYVKVEVGICKGKHTYDKKDTLKQKDLQRELERNLSKYN